MKVRKLVKRSWLEALFAKILKAGRRAGGSSGRFSQENRETAGALAHRRFRLGEGRGNGSGEAA